MRIDRYKFVVELMKRDLTIKDFAKLANISKSTATNIKSGKACSSLVANVIAQTLGVELKDLLENND